MSCFENLETTANPNTQYNQVRFLDIIEANWPWNAQEFPPVRPSEDHVVLYQVSKGSKELVPYKEQDKWDANHVRMPHTNFNKESFINYKTGSRWALIEMTLKKLLVKNVIDSKALIGAILKYNGKFKYDWKFKALENYLDSHLRKHEKEDFFTNTLRGIIKLALQLPDLIQAPIPLLKRYQNKSLSLTQEQIASLLANAFLCTFPWRNTIYRNSEAAKLPKINFASLYESTEESANQKLRCICNYFKRVISKPPTGVVTFSRRYVPLQDCPPWETLSDPIWSLPVFVDSSRKIEDAEGLIQVDFANKYLGGGVLGNGLVQEEIKFLMYPELMASMIFTESLESTEALMIIGCVRYNDSTGYGHNTFRWSEKHCDMTPMDSSLRRRCAVLAIDAEPYWYREQQFQKEKIERELNKAWIGFSFFGDNSNDLLYPGVATGNWGCGAFNGVPQLKCLIQIMAATVAKRPLAYYTFGDQRFKHEVETIYESCRKLNVTVGQLFKCILAYNFKTDLHAFLKQIIQKELSQYQSANATNLSNNGEPKNGEQYTKENLLDFDSQVGGPSTKDYSYAQNKNKQTHHQRREHQNTTADYTDPYSQKMTGHTQHGNRGGDDTQNNCRSSSKNYGPSSSKESENSGSSRRGRTPNKSSPNRRRGGASQSRNKLNWNPESRPDIHQKTCHQEKRGQGLPHMRDTKVRHGWAEQDSSQIYQLMGNMIRWVVYIWQRI